MNSMIETIIFFLLTLLSLGLFVVWFLEGYRLQLELKRTRIALEQENRRFMEEIERLKSSIQA